MIDDDCVWLDGCERLGWCIGLSCCVVCLGCERLDCVD